jgi:hypothetical protein
MHQLQILNRNVAYVMLGHRQCSVSHSVLEISDVSPVLDIRVVSAKRCEKEKMCPILGGRSPLT